MRNIFVISDTHFGHSNILTFTNYDGSMVRSFSSCEEMDELMIENWNKTVSDQDIIYHLGDVYFGKGYNHLHRLKGRKRLIIGNHDNPKSEYLINSFEKIMMWRMFPEFNLLLTHVPVHESTLGERRFKNVPMTNIHGHNHCNPSPAGNYKCVCVEQTNYMPINIEELRIK